MTVWERVCDIEGRAKDEILCVLSEFVDGHGGDYHFGKGTTLVTSQNDLIFLTSIYKDNEDYLLEYQPECGDYESVYLSDLELSMLVKIAGEINE